MKEMRWELVALGIIGGMCSGELFQQGAYAHAVALLIVLVAALAITAGREVR